MHESDAGEDKPLPVQQTRQPQPVRGMQEEAWAARARSLPHSVLEGHGGNRRRVPEAPRPGFDEARFTAGIVRFYEAVLREPIPEKMLRLLDEIGKQERKP